MYVYMDIYTYILNCFINIHSIYKTYMIYNIYYIYYICSTMLKYKFKDNF